mmetsp:Transcript_58994/g.132054  ORF Transcript_58994/g.132054 Transcript_58994/m.132054 type:complete len:590 (+) Transcript_58994:79-1848(+)
MVKNYTIKKQVSVEEAVEGLVVAIRQCDYDQLESHMLGGLQKVVDAHLQQDNPDSVSVLQYADRNGGPEALLQLEHPHAHRLLHGVASIPEVCARLECMHKDATFDDSMEGCEMSLKVLREGLARLVACLSAIQSFFVVCLQLGNAVNTGSAAPVARHGFKLCALQKLLDVKAPNKSGLSLFHVAVAMMTPETAAELCNPDLSSALLQAKLARGASVYKDCLRALESFQILATVARTGVFKGREIPRTAHRPQGGSARLAASTDNFWPRMLALAERGKPAAARVKRLCISVVHGYNDLGLFFDDAMCLWPPPQDDTDKEKLDLFSVFHDFVTNFAKARSEVEQTRFVSEVQKQFSYSFSLGSQAEPELETIRAASLTPRKRPSSLTPRGNIGFDMRDLSPARPRARTPNPQRSPVKAENPQRSPVKAENPQRSPVKAEMPPRSPMKADARPRSPVKADVPPRSPVRTDMPPRSPVKAETPKRNSEKAENDSSMANLPPQGASSPYKSVASPKRPPASPDAKTSRRDQVSLCCCQRRSPPRRPPASPDAKAKLRQEQVELTTATPPRKRIPGSIGSPLTPVHEQGETPYR